MVVWAVEPALRDILERKLDLMRILQRVAKRPPEKPVGAARAALALAAAECVAAAAGRPPDNPPDVLLRWLGENPAGPPVPLMAAAIKAIDRLRYDPDAPPGAPLADLRSRLSGR